MDDGRNGNGQDHGPPGENAMEQDACWPVTAALAVYEESIRNGRPMTWPNLRRLMLRYAHACETKPGSPQGLPWRHCIELLRNVFVRSQPSAQSGDDQKGYQQHAR